MKKTTLTALAPTIGRAKSATIKLVLLILWCLCGSKLSAQSENINPKGKWYFGAELGTNRITSFDVTGDKTSIQGGVIAEYYFARHWSLSGKIKYFNTGVSFFKPNTHSGSWIDLGSDEAYGNFKGSVIAVPVDIKWEFRIYKNFAGSLKLGVAFNVETKSEYGEYSSNLSPEKYKKTYVSLSAGYGFNYFIDKNFAAYFDLQAFNGATKGESDDLFGTTYYNTRNRLLSLGVKYNFGS